jgi:hypothetical protein
MTSAFQVEQCLGNGLGNRNGGPVIKSAQFFMERHECSIQWVVKDRKSECRKRAARSCGCGKKPNLSLGEHKFKSCGACPSVHYWCVCGLCVSHPLCVSRLQYGTSACWCSRDLSIYLTCMGVCVLLSQLARLPEAALGRGPPRNVGRRRRLTRRRRRKRKRTRASERKRMRKSKKRAITARRRWTRKGREGGRDESYESVLHTQPLAARLFSLCCNRNKTSLCRWNLNCAVWLDKGWMWKATDGN